MKLLLDECLPERLRLHIPGHDVYTARYMNWAGVENGELLALAAAEGFDALLTADRAIEKEHDLTKLPIAIVVLHAASNDIGDFLLLVPNVLKLLNHLPPKAISHVRP